MSTKTFGRPLEEETVEFGRVIDAPSPPSSTGKDIAKQAAIGGAKGLFGTYGDILDLLNLQSEEMLPGEESQRQREFEALERMHQPGYKPSIYDLMALSDEDDIVPRYSRLPSSKEVEEFAQILGVETSPETTPGKFSRRIGEAVGSGASLGAGGKALAALGTGAGIGQGVEEVTDSPTAGLIAEILSTLGLGGLKKSLAPRSAKGKELVERGRKIGLTEKELTPLVQSERKLATFSPLARKGKKTTESFRKINEKLGGAYELVREEASQHGRLTASQNEKLLKDFGEINKKLRTTLKASPEKQSAIKFIEDSMENIRNRGTSSEELIGFWGDINNAVNWNAVKGGKKSINALKKPIREILRDTDSQLAKDFELTNELYTRYKKAARALKPDMIDKWLNKGEAAAIVASFATGNPTLLKGIASESAIRLFSKELLTNPRLQNISNKALQAIRTNKGAAGSEALKGAKKILEKKYPDEDWEFLEMEVESP